MDGRAAARQIDVLVLTIVVRVARIQVKGRGAGGVRGAGYVLVLVVLVIWQLDWAELAALLRQGRGGLLHARDLGLELAILERALLGGGLVYEILT